MLNDGLDFFFLGKGFFCVILVVRNIGKIYWILWVCFIKEFMNIFLSKNIIEKIKYIFELFVFFFLSVWNVYKG